MVHIPDHQNDVSIAFPMTHNYGGLDTLMIIEDTWILLFLIC